MMQMTEDLLFSLVKELHGKPTLTYQGTENRLHATVAKDGFPSVPSRIREARSIDSERSFQSQGKGKGLGVELMKEASLGRVLAELFDELVEPKLIQPTFITLYPTDVSPLSRRNPEDPEIVDRFELFIAGREIANGFSELNDPIDQRERFLQQLRDRSDEGSSSLRLDEDS